MLAEQTGGLFVALLERGVFYCLVSTASIYNMAAIPEDREL